MKKIPTLFKRIFDEQHRKSVSCEVTLGMEWVLAGEGLATVRLPEGLTPMVDLEWWSSVC